MCILYVHVYALLKVVGCYDLSVLSMSVIKKVCVDYELHQFFLYFWNFFNFAKPLCGA